MTADQFHPSDNPAAEQEPVDVAALTAALEAAEARALESKDLYMRALAELENVRKRSVREVEQAHKYAVDRFANDLVGVKDSLELGVDAAGDVDTLRAGTEATLKLLAKAFEKAGLVEIDPQGEVFNPELHEAMVAQPSAEHVPNAVMQVVQKGYQLNGRLLRPARVIVAREP
ncbi:nucleotide exchange factor GrpE [Povalibacter sp.]|uniref:nucleotide exchange factor GrpE n=1 Tax=Povalibacter sp. TaxID=1962978 RepID=UPI002F3E58E4